VALNGLALVVRARDPEEALQLYRRTYDLIVRTHGQPNGDAGIVLANIGALQTRVRRYEEAKESLEEALPLVSKFHGADDHRVGGIAGNLAVVHKELGNYERALELSRRDLEISTRVLGPEHPAIGATWLNMARTTTRMGEQEGALEQVEKAIRIFRSRFDEKHPLLVTAQNSRGLILLRLGRADQARALWTQLLSLSPESVDGQKALLSTRLLLADLERVSGAYGPSLELGRRVLQDPLVAKDPHLETEARWTIAYTLAQQGSTAEAEAERGRALALHQGTAFTTETAVLYARAKYYACAGDPKRTLELLRQAVQKGFRDAAVLADTTFADVQRRPEFAPIAAAVTARPQEPDNAARRSQI
jgi:tetratricopeptide (TPR) repeat protein